MVSDRGMVHLQTVRSAEISALYTRLPKVYLAIEFQPVSLFFKKRGARFYSSDHVMLRSMKSYGTYR